MNMTDFVRMEALEEGEEIGLAKGVAEAQEKFVKKLLAGTEFSNEKIADLLDVPLTLVETLCKAVRN